MITKRFLYFIILTLYVFSACKKDSDKPFPEESYLKLIVDGNTYEYHGKEIGGTYAQGWATSPAVTMLYTTGIATSKPSFYIHADAPGLTKDGKFWVFQCVYGIDPLNGPFFNETNSTDPEKRKLIITRLHQSQLQWEGNFYVEVIGSANDKKITSGEFAIAIK